MRCISKKDFTIILVSTIDHFDTAMYVFISPIIAPLFFPSNNSVIELILAYSVFSTSLITKPLGNYIFGTLVRYYTPSYLLLHSLMGVGLATICIGLLPEYYYIGFISPILLTIIRMVRDIFAAGESTISNIYILDNKTDNEAFKSSYIYQASIVFGIVLASLVTTIVQYFSIEYPWRMCFIFSGFISIISYFIRLRIFTENSYMRKPAPIKNISPLWKYKSSIMRIALVSSFSHITYTVPFITMNHIIPFITNIEIKTMMFYSSCTLFIDMLLIPLIGNYIKHFSINNVMLYSSGVLAITIIPIWYYLEGSSIIYVNFVRFWIIIWGVIFLCPLNLWNSIQVKSNEKFIIVGIGNSLGSCTVGKLSPFICLTLFYYTNSYLSIAIYIAFLSILVFLIVYFSKKTKTY